MPTVSSSRLRAVISSGCLNKRARLRNQLDDVSIRSMADLTELTEEDQKLLSLFKLEFMYGSLFATILEDTITEIRILGECNNKVRQKKAIADYSVMRDQKFKVAAPLNIDDLSSVDPKNLRKEEYKLDKLAADRKFIFETLLVTYLDLSQHISFESLAQAISSHIENNYRREKVFREEAKNRAHRRELAKQLRLQRNHMTSANYDLDVVIDGLRIQVEDANMISETHSRYTNKWEQSRTEQHAQWIQNREVPAHKLIVHTKHRLDTEHRVHSEIMLLVNLIINETMEKVEVIMTKYDEDTEEIDLKIQIMKNNYSSERDKRIELEETYLKHTKECKDWKEFKLERERTQKYNLDMHNAANVVQAWWRGLLYRLQLGPYKPEIIPPPSMSKKDDKKKKKRK